MGRSGCQDLKLRTRLVMWHLESPSRLSGGGFWALMGQNWHQCIDNDSKEDVPWCFPPSWTRTFSTPRPTTPVSPMMKGPRSHTGIGDQRVPPRPTNGESSALRRHRAWTDAPCHRSRKPWRRHLETDARVDQAPVRSAPETVSLGLAPPRRFPASVSVSNPHRPNTRSTSTLARRSPTGRQPGAGIGRCGSRTKPRAVAPSPCGVCRKDKNRILARTCHGALRVSRRCRSSAGMSSMPSR